MIINYIRLGCYVGLFMALFIVSLKTMVMCVIAGYLVKKMAETVKILQW